MAVSGSKDFAITKSQIIAAALRKIGAYDQGEAIPGEENAAASIALNLFVKSLPARGADLFLRQEVTLFLQKNEQKYLLGSTAEATTNFVATTLSAAEASGQTVIGVTSTTGMLPNDRIGIKMDDATMHWSTISKVQSAASVQIATATDAAAASGNNVYAYTTRSVRPQKLEYVSRRDTNAIDTPVDLIGENEYRRLSQKTSDGPPTQAWYHPSLDAGTLYVWPTNGGSSYDKLVLIQDILPDDMDSAGNNPQFPIEWGEVLIYGTADRLAPEYGLPIMERRELKTELEFHLKNALDYDVENASVIFVAGR